MIVGWYSWLGAAVERAVFIVGPRLSGAGTLVTYSGFSASEVSLSYRSRSKTGAAGNRDLPVRGDSIALLPQRRKR
jgi:hypothetical protein